MGNGKKSKKLILEDAKVITSGHFVGKDGRHYQYCLDINVLFCSHFFTKLACENIGRQFKKDCIDIVVGISNHASLTISHWVTAFLSASQANKTCKCTGYDNGKFFNEERLNFKGMNILIVRSKLCDGDCTEEVVKKVRRAGGNVVGVGAFCNIDSADLCRISNPPRLYSMRNFSSRGYEKCNCPMCKAGLPIDRKPKSGILSSI